MTFNFDNESEGKSLAQPGRGLAVWPLEQSELDLLRGLFEFADDYKGLARPFNPANMRPLDTDELKKLRFKVSSNVFIVDIKGGTVLEIDFEAAIPAPSVQRITVQQAITAGYPGASAFSPRPDDNPPYPGELDAYWLVLYVHKAQKGDKGDQGDQGEKGDKGDQGDQGEKGDKGDQGDQGEKGDKGDKGDSTACDCPDITDGGETGPPGGPGGGSGPGGQPNADGLDTTVYVAGCDPPVIDYPYCSDSFNFTDTNIRAAIDAAVVASGHFNSAAEMLISVVLNWQGLSYAGVAIFENTTEYPALGQVKVLTVKDSEDNTLVVPHFIEGVDIFGLATYQSFKYAGSTGLRMLPDGHSILVNGEMPKPVFGTCHDPASGIDPAWLKVCLIEFTKRRKPIICPDNASNPHAIQVPFTFNTPGDAAPSYLEWGYDSGWNTEGPYMFSTGRVERFNVYGFVVGRTYGMKIQTQVINGSDFSWAITLPGYGYTQYGSAGIHVNGTGNNAPVEVTLPAITITAIPGLQPCDLFDVAVYGYLSIKHLEIYEI